MENNASALEMIKLQGVPYKLYNFFCSNIEKFEATTTTTVLIFSESVCHACLAFCIVHVFRLDCFLFVNTSTSFYGFKFRAQDNCSYFPYFLIHGVELLYEILVGDGFISNTSFFSVVDTRFVT